MNNAIDWVQFCAQIKRLPRHQLWRHNSAGDLPHNNGTIDAAMLQQLVESNKGKRGYTYTHHLLTEANLVALRNANRDGFTINASTESVEAADRIMTDHAIPAVSVVPSTEKRRFFRTESGRRVIVCPATVHENVSCLTCGLCQNKDRNFIIAFPAHGTAKKTVDGIVTAS
jgi:hypothetical protein